MAAPSRRAGRKTYHAKACAKVQYGHSRRFAKVETGGGLALWVGGGRCGVSFRLSLLRLLHGLLEEESRGLERELKAEGLSPIRQKPYKVFHPFRALRPPMTYVLPSNDDRTT